MQAFEFSTRIPQGNSLPIPLDIRSQVVVGMPVRVVFLVEPAYGTLEVDVDAELLALVEQIQATPLDPALITPATERLSPAKLEMLLQEHNPDFDLEQWNAEWDSYERESKRRARENEQKYLADMAPLLQ